MSVSLEIDSELNCQPIAVTGLIVFEGWWGKKSALLSDKSILFKIKKLFIQKLIEAGMATTKDLDRRNINPHIQLNLVDERTGKKTKIAKFTINENENAQAMYDKLQNTSITLTEKSLIIEKDFLEIDTGEDTHMTLFFKKEIGDEKNHKQLNEIWLETLKDISNGITATETMVVDKMTKKPKR
jgi:hypothetical protein